MLVKGIEGEGVLAEERIQGGLVLPDQGSDGGHVLCQFGWVCLL